MWEKVILSVPLKTILGLQFANSLTCLSCDTLDSCLQPTQQVCNDATANASSLWLATMHADVPFIAHSDKFKCINLTYAFNPSNIRAHEFLGLTSVIATLGSKIVMSAIGICAIVILLELLAKVALVFLHLFSALA